MDEKIDEKIQNAIEAVEHPEITLSLVDLGMVRDIQVKDSHATMALVVPFMGIPEVVKQYMVNSLTQAVQEAGGEVDDIRIEVMTDAERMKFFQMEQSHWRT
ncbi:MAG: DUF59 domain-containing protein [Deltaproteobacteria bacterium]|nr:DUF59 domain-containing protein [Deltaproteobacteria bacterium]